MKLGRLIVCCGALQFTLGSTQFAHAQQPGIGDAVRQSNETLRAAPSTRPAETLVLPQLVDPPFILKDKETLYVSSFLVSGPILVDEEAIRAILIPYENRKLTLAEIYEAADKLTTLYRSKGYLVAKAYVPQQNAKQGVLRIKIVPGTFGAVTLKNESLVRDDFLQGVMDGALAGSPYIHQDEIERAMLLMSDLAGAGMPRIAIGRGQQPETSDFVFNVPETRRIDGYLTGDNYGSPFSGRNRLSGGINLNSPLGFGDRFSATGIVSQDSQLVNGRVAYSTPLGYSGLRGEVSAFRTTYVLGGIYQPLNATGTADAISGSLMYPLFRRRDDSVYISVNFTHKELNDNVLGVSLANRKMDEGTVSLNRDTITSLIGMPLTINSSVSLTRGYVNFPDPAQNTANKNGVNTAGDFVKLAMTLNTTLAFTDNLSLTTSIRAQKSMLGNNLDSSEQLGLTGFYGVRSFDEGLSGDTGYLVTPELKYALPSIENYRHSVGLFTDVGGVWIQNPVYTTTQKPFTRLNDVGLGYYATYEYLPTRFLLLKAQVAHTYGSDGGAQTYDKGTKGLLQVGLTF